jgi:hypothetical protein
MSSDEEAALRRGKGGNCASWADANLAGPKIKKINTVDSVGTNER